MTRVVTGLERLRTEPELQKLLSGRRVGLLAHAASIDADFRHAKDIVAELGDLRVLFGPEHGFAADAQDMEPVEEDGEASGMAPSSGASSSGASSSGASSSGASASGVSSSGASSSGVSSSSSSPRVISLYGTYPEDLSPRQEHLEDLDVLVVDLQDVGSRYYTYVWTAAFALRACARAGVHVVVLDRPNPIGGVVREGAPQRPAYRSFVGLYEVPVRHGLTLGELVLLCAGRERIDRSRYTLVTMKGWKRAMHFGDTGLPWVLPSPNMPTVDTALVYPGGCILEGTTLSEGRGTTRPFELFGGPGVDGEAIAAAHADLAERCGARLRPLHFTPTVRDHAGVRCGGVQVHIAEPTRLRSVTLYRGLIAAMARARAPEAPWRTEPYEYERHRPAIDLLTGNVIYRQLVNAVFHGEAGADEALDDFHADEQRAADAFEAQTLYD